MHHYVDVADIEVDELRRAGYEVDQCSGPIGRDACPVMHGKPCWQVDEADVLVYDMWASGDGHRELIEDLRDLHADKPVVVTSPGLVLDWIQADGPHGVMPVLGALTRAELVAAVEAALKAAAKVEAPGKAERRPQEPTLEQEHIPRW